MFEESVIDIIINTKIIGKHFKPVERYYLVLFLIFVLPFPSGMQKKKFFKKKLEFWLI